jgi:gamma-glutamyltranspeptidase/glutathione hydrolase
VERAGLPGRRRPAADSDAGLQRADRPWGRHPAGARHLFEARDTLHIEGRFPETTITELARRGHIIDRWPDWNESAGHANGITIDPTTGVLSGGADPRSDGEAVGF